MHYNRAITGAMDVELYAFGSQLQRALERRKSVLGPLARRPTMRDESRTLQSDLWTS